MSDLRDCPHGYFLGLHCEDCHAQEITAKHIDAMVSDLADRDNELTRLRALNEELVGALRGLRNEAGAILSMGDTLRAVTGNTNVECLQHRVKIADYLLARTKDGSNG